MKNSLYEVKIKQKLFYFLLNKSNNFESKKNLKRVRIYNKLLFSIHREIFEFGSIN